MVDITELIKNEPYQICYEYGECIGYEKGCKESRTDLVMELHKIYSNQKLTDEEVLEQIKLVLNREIMEVDTSNYNTKPDAINLNGKQVTIAMVGNSEDTAVNLIHKVMNGEYERN